jgi:hypothetical protein
MLKPVTPTEKLGYTVQQQLVRGTEELLAEIYESGYTGYVDIWHTLKFSKGQVVFDMHMMKIPSSAIKPKHSPYSRWYVVQGKGVKAVGP